MRKSTQPDFQPTRAAALEQLNQVRPNAYEKTRNYLDGAVTYLSPWISHGFLDTREVVSHLHSKNPLSFEDKIVFELAWREFFRHAHQHLGQDIFQSIRRPVYSGKYSARIPDDVLEGRTGVDAIDLAVRHLYETGYLHNHMRMWLASYLVHMRKVNWRAGADWMYGHLLDGDLASNHLSWQWVAGTFSHKPYVFNAENVKKFAAHIDCSGTCIDTDYADLSSIATQSKDVGPEANRPHLGVEQPALVGNFSAGYELTAKSNIASTLPPIESFDAAAGFFDSLNADKNHTVQWVHPWDLGLNLESKTPKVAVFVTDFHKKLPWSQKRWEFVLTRLMSKEVQIIALSLSDFKKLERHLHSNKIAIQMTETHHPDYADLCKLQAVSTQAVPTIFESPWRFQSSFSRFYKSVTESAESLDSALGLQRVGDLFKTANS